MMKPKNKNTLLTQESLLKAVDKPCAVDKDFLDRLAEQSAQEFEQATEIRKSQQPGGGSIWRHIMKNRILQFTSAAVILIVAIVGISMVTGTASVTFAEVIKPILNSHTISYDFIVGNERDGVTMTDIVTKSRIRRTIGDATMIIDLDNKKMLALDNTDKIATYLDFKGPLRQGTQLFVDFIRETILEMQKNGDLKAENLGEKTIDGREVIGFRTGKIGKSIVIWGDAKTAVPIQIEMDMGPQNFIIKNLKFNIPVDASKIAMDVPEGYKLEQTDLDLSSATEQEFIDGLKIWIEVLLDGQFPDAITPEAYMKSMSLLEQKLEEKVKASAMSEEAAILLAQQYLKGMMFINLFQVQGNSDLHYAGKDAVYGDRDTPVFWYKPKNSKNFRVIYADLSAKEVAPDQLPR